MEWIAPAPPDEAAIVAKIRDWNSTIKSSGFLVEKIPDDVDWREKAYRAFPPFSVGPFFIYGSHFENPVPNGQLGLKIDAATAFGSGEHGTTKGCLRAMLDLKGKGACPWNTLDMGSGSGILAIAAWKLWKSPVLAIDNDEEATIVAMRHRDMNAVPSDSKGMLCDTGDGFHAPIVQQKKPFDLIIANILAPTLKEMVADLKTVSDENGYVILSGILTEQAADVFTVYQAIGFELIKREDIGEWSTLTLRNRG